MESCALGWLENDVDSRTQQARMSKLVDDVKPCSEVDSQRIEYFPLILQIESVDEPALA